MGKAPARVMTMAFSVVGEKGEDRELGKGMDRTGYECYQGFLNLARNIWLFVLVVDT